MRTPADILEVRLKERLRVVQRLRAANRWFYERTIDGIDGSWVVMGGRKLLHLCSYSYLGLNHLPCLVEEALRLASPFIAGTGGTRVVCGTTRLHIELEAEIAAWLGTEKALLIPSGFSANTSLLSALCSPGDLLLADQSVHASITDGLILTRAEVRNFAHNDLDQLERLLYQGGGRLKGVIVDGVYSMDGDLCPLLELQRLCDSAGAFLYVDDAHGLGVLGPEGAGIHSHLGTTIGRHELIMGTISKAIPSIGGFAAGSAAMIDALKGNCRSYIFSSATPPIDTAMALCSIRYIRTHQELIVKLWSNQRYYIEQLKTRGIQALNTATPIVPLMCLNNEQAFEITQRCEVRGLMVLPAIYPVVPLHLPRIRTTITAAMSHSEIDFAVDVLAEAFGQCASA